MFNPLPSGYHAAPMPVRSDVAAESALQTDFSALFARMRAGAVQGPVPGVVPLTDGPAARPEEGRAEQALSADDEGAWPGGEMADSEEEPGPVALRPVPFGKTGAASALMPSDAPGLPRPSARALPDALPGDGGVGGAGPGALEWPISSHLPVAREALPAKPAVRSTERGAQAPMEGDARRATLESVASAPSHGPPYAPLPVLVPRAIAAPVAETSGGPMTGQGGDEARVVSAPVPKVMPDPVGMPGGEVRPDQAARREIGPAAHVGGGRGDDPGPVMRHHALPAVPAHLEGAPALPGRADVPLGVASVSPVPRGAQAEGGLPLRPAAANLPGVAAHAKLRVSDARPIRQEMAMDAGARAVQPERALPHIAFGSPPEADRQAPIAREAGSFSMVRAPGGIGQPEEGGEPGLPEPRAARLVPAPVSSVAWPMRDASLPPAPNGENPRPAAISSSTEKTISRDDDAARPEPRAVRSRAVGEGRSSAVPPRAGFVTSEVSTGQPVVEGARFEAFSAMRQGKGREAVPPAGAEASARNTWPVSRIEGSYADRPAPWRELDLPGGGLARMAALPPERSDALPRPDRAAVVEPTQARAPALAATPPGDVRPWPVKPVPDVTARPAMQAAPIMAPSPAPDPRGEPPAPQASLGEAGGFEAALPGPSATMAVDRAPGADPRPGPGPSSPPPVAQQLAAAITGTAEGRIEIRLDPEELGRVALQLQTDGDRISLVITAERSETSELLRRHLHELAQDFRAMGYRSVDLGFGGQNGAHDRSGGAERARSGAGAGPPLQDAEDETPAAPIPSSGPVGAGLDLRM
ncbi:hypothetical protein CJ301_06255 [Limimaricola cinnabarinus]|uniref:Flagellar hook-length control protein-like C-terminal domain-containing protein n=2 Tax=Limimaricola cinnabarinus TaxID=1125964 RepID=A0A2G1MI56_9RHOB|nr:hypothetical protein CJ301_06255 [Limimaricola cinnabarinus]